MIKLIGLIGGGLFAFPVYKQFGWPLASSIWMIIFLLFEIWILQFKTSEMASAIKDRIPEYAFDNDFEKDS